MAAVIGLFIAYPTALTVEHILDTMLTIVEFLLDEVFLVDRSLG
jgi:hypothetical protein